MKTKMDREMIKDAAARARQLATPNQTATAIAFGYAYTYSWNEFGRRFWLAVVEELQRKEERGVW